jgi:ribosomal protein RSM22 (predicted rRNA methylase)
MQPPPFVRVTKRTRAGFEDMQFSYVVIQRGARPDRVDTKVGRMGNFGRKDKGVSKTTIKELKIHVEGTESAVPSRTEIPEDADPDHGMSPSELQAQLRREAYQWPRLIFSPLKNGGHAILDACTVEGVSCPHFPIFFFSLQNIRKNNETHYYEVSRKASFL